ncbi:MAG: hypothetical protein H6P96_411 [Candidatus Aminicenantes bacterium]|nr:hypothetical protein [Candidatus Aminicenantes bacterium]
MKRTAALIFVLLSLLLIVCHAPSPAFPQNAATKTLVFTIKLVAKGEYGRESFEKTVEAVYAPVTIYGSAETLLRQRGGIAGMEPDDILQLYITRKTGSGHDSTGVSGSSWTIGDGIFGWTVNTGDETISGDTGENSRNSGMAPSLTSVAEITRTEDGAELWIGEPGVDGVEGYGEFFGIFEGNNVPDGLSDALTFKFTNEELKNWTSLQKTNDRTLAGPEGGTLKISVSFHGGALPGAAEVKLDGCFEVGEGGQGQVTAAGTPPGGTYRFRVIPPDVMKVQASGATATLTGGSPDEGTLFVEYTTPDGKTAEASHGVASVRLVSINGGAAIPEIPLYDIDQKKLPAVLEVPMKVLPQGAGASLVFVPDDPSIVTLVNLGDAVAIQGLKEGRTAFQARFKCGGPFGPKFPVEIVRCDKETIAALDQRLRDAFENRRTAAKDFGKAMNSRQFQDAADNLPAATAKLAWKTSLLIGGTLSGYGKTTQGVKTVTDVAGKLDAFGDIINDIATQPGAFDQIKNWAGLIAEFSENRWAQLIADAEDTMSTAVEVGNMIGDMVGQSGRMAEAAKWMENWNKVIEDTVKRQKFCRKTEQPPAKEDPPKEPEKPQPKPKTDPKKTTPTPKPTPTPPDPPMPPDPEPPGDTWPPPPGRPRQVGLPYEPGDCGCGKTLAITQNPEGFASISTGFGNLLDCVDRFQKDLAGYTATLQEITITVGKLDAAAKAGGAALSAAAKEAAPAFGAFSTKVKGFGAAAKTFDDGFRTCPDATKAGISFLQSAKDYAKAAESEGGFGVRK